jgi:putative toxin-antitoxin system antitoxin component (TIGR02293 family)
MPEKEKPYLKHTTKHSVPYVKEAQRAYSIKTTTGKEHTSPGLKVIKSTAQNTAVILTGATNIPENQMSYFEKTHVVKEGISKEDLENLKKKATLDYDKLAKALSVTRATLINKKKHEKFNAVLSERILSLADIYSYGYEVFEDEEKFNAWIFKPNQALGGCTPYDLIDNQFGREEVKNLIGRIAYGVYS